MIGKSFLKKIGIFTMSLVISVSCMMHPAYAKNNNNNGNNGNNGNNKKSQSNSVGIDNFFQGVGEAINSAEQFINNGVNEVNNTFNEIIYGKEEESISNSQTNIEPIQSNNKVVNESSTIENNNTVNESQNSLVTYEKLTNSTMDKSITSNVEEPMKSKTSGDVANLQTKKEENRKESENTTVDLSEVITTAESEDENVNEDIEDKPVLTGAASTNSTVVDEETELLAKNLEQSNNTKYVLGGIVFALATILIYYFVKKSREEKNVILTDSMTAQKIAIDTTGDKSIIEVKTADLEVAEQLRKEVSSEIKSIKKSLDTQNKDIEEKKVEKKRLSKDKAKTCKKEKIEFIKETKKSLKIKKIDNKKIDDFEIEVC